MRLHFAEKCSEVLLAARRLVGEGGLHSKEVGIPLLAALPLAGTLGTKVSLSVSDLKNRPRTLAKQLYLCLLCLLMPPFKSTGNHPHHSSFQSETLFPVLPHPPPPPRVLP